MKHAPPSKTNHNDKHNQKRANKGKKAPSNVSNMSTKMFKSKSKVKVNISGFIRPIAQNSIKLLSFKNKRPKSRPRKSCPSKLMEKTLRSPCVSGVDGRSVPSEIVKKLIDSKQQTFDNTISTDPKPYSPVESLVSVTQSSVPTKLIKSSLKWSDMTAKSSICNQNVQSSLESNDLSFCTTQSSKITDKHSQIRDPILMDPNEYRSYQDKMDSSTPKSSLNSDAQHSACNISGNILSNVDCLIKADGNNDTITPTGTLLSKENLKVKSSSNKSGIVSKMSTDSGAVSTTSMSGVSLEGGLKIPRVVLSFGYEFFEEIGSGGFAKVYKVRNQQEFPDKIIACKLFNLRQVNSNWARKHLHNEMKIMQKMNHPNVMHAYKVIKTSHHAFIFMPFASHGNILNYMYYNKHKPLQEGLSRLWFRALVTGLHYLHTNSIVHRDLKLENFLLDENFVPLISDFGFAVIAKTVSTFRSVITRKIFTSSNVNHSNSGSNSRSRTGSMLTGFVQNSLGVMCDTICGTPEYVAPEVHLLRHGAQYDGKPADIYAMGVSLFEMVNFTKPFLGGPFTIRSAALVKLQLDSQYTYNKRVKLTSACRALIESMMNPTVHLRPTTTLVLKSDWFVEKPLKSSANHRHSKANRPTSSPGRQ